MKNFLRKIGNGICIIGSIFYWVYKTFICHGNSGLGGHTIQNEKEKRIISFIFGITFLLLLCMFIGLAVA